MTFKLMFKYLVGLALIVYVFAKVSWHRTEDILKNYIVAQTQTNLHNMNSAKFSEIEGKIAFYIQSAQKVQQKLLEKRETTSDEEIENDITGADLFSLKNKKYSLTSSYANVKFLKNRELTNDFFRETVGANPLNFSMLDYSNVFVQKLHGSDKKTEMLAIANRISATSVMVIYVDLQRFQNLFVPLEGHQQMMFEPVEGLIASTNPSSTEDLNEHPAVVAMNKENKTVIRTSYIKPGSESKIFTSLIRSPAGYYVLTEADEAYLFKPVYLLKSNFAKAIGILFSAIVVLLSFMGLLTSTKAKNISDQLDAYMQRRALHRWTSGSALKDEFDQISQQIYKTIETAEKKSSVNVIVKKFGAVGLLEKLNLKKVDLNQVDANILLAQLELISDANAAKDILIKEYDQLQSYIEELIAPTNGVVISQLNTSISLAWGFFDEDPRSDLRGLNSLLEIEALLNQQLSGFRAIKSFAIFVTQGKATAHMNSSRGQNELLYFGKPFEEIQKLVQFRTVLDKNIVVVTGVASKATKYFNFDPEFKFSNAKNSEMFQKIRSQDVKLNVVKLTHRTREIAVAAN